MNDKERLPQGTTTDRPPTDQTDDVVDRGVPLLVLGLTGGA